MSLTKMYSSFNGKDAVEKLFYLFIDLKLKWNAILKKQFESAKIEFHNCGSSWFFDFHYECAIPSVRTTQRVPIMIEICKEFVINGSNVHKLIGRENSYWIDEKVHSATDFYVNTNLSHNYTGVYLHFKDGAICEIEVVDWNGAHLEADVLFAEIVLGQCMYRITESKIIDELERQEDRG